MFPNLTRYTLMSALYASMTADAGRANQLTDLQGKGWWLLAVEREDGTGRSFNLRLRSVDGRDGTRTTYVTTYVRTVD